jgi:hypothetical protein
VDHQRAAEIQVLLEGVRLPASRRELVDYARVQDPAASSELASLPDRSYESIDDVGEALAPVQPAQREPERLPRPESGEPPGGPEYVNPFPESGALRYDAPPDNPPERVLEQQASLQKRQKQRQGG